MTNTKNMLISFLTSDEFDLFDSRMTDKYGEQWSNIPLKKATFLDVAELIGINPSRLAPAFTKENRVSFGYYTMSSSASAPRDEIVNFPGRDQTAPQEPMTQTFSAVSCRAEIPSKDREFIKWGHYKDIKQIIQSNEFFPIYISGFSGTGKTMMIKNICADLKRPFVRVQFTPETSYEDLIGSFRLTTNVYRNVSVSPSDYQRFLNSQ